MPSDPSGRHPLGVLSRIAPDWFDDQLGIGAFATNNPVATPPTYVAIALFNNATDGSSFKVYGLSVFSNGGGGTSFFSPPTTIGALAGPCVSLRPDVGNPFGQIFTVSTAVATPSTPSPFNFGPLVGFIGNNG